MKYVITGGAGNISKPLALQLLKAGHEVTVIGRNIKNLEPLVEAGATPLTGNVEDQAFLTTAFTGADAVYTMVPPVWDAEDWKGYIGNIGKNYAAAIESAGVKYVVNLSSIGAHLPHGAGPISGIYRVEHALNVLENVNIKHVRAALFYNNFYSNIGMVKHMNILGGNYGGGDTLLVMVDPQDIAAAVVKNLLALDFSGNSIEYVASDEQKASEVAKILGAAVGKTDLPWVNFADEQTHDALLQAGLTKEVADNYTEMGTALRDGKIYEEYLQNNNRTLGVIKLHDFAKSFAAAYAAS